MLPPFLTFEENSTSENLSAHILLYSFHSTLAAKISLSPLFFPSLSPQMSYTYVINFKGSSNVILLSK